MRLTANLLQTGSYAVRIWPDAPPGIGWAPGPYGTVCVIEPLTQDECQIAPCRGVLNNEINIALGIKCLSLGFKVMHFSVEEGMKVTRWAEYTKTEDGMDFYMVDLIKTAEQI